MTAIVCFSGGHSSALAAIETVRKYGAKNTVLLNHDISSKVEHADIKRFKQEIADYCKVAITYANANNFEEITPLRIVMQKQMFGLRVGHRFCTKILKTDPFYSFLEKNYKSATDTHIVYGFDKNETNRIDRRSAIIRAMGYTPEFPLAHWKRTIESTKEIGIVPPVTYKIYKHANCVGCLKAGRQHWYCVFCTRPDIWEEAKAVEEKIGYSIIKDVFLKDLEPQYLIMRDEQHICPNDKDESAIFWKRVNEMIPNQTEMFEIPCDCSF